MADRLYRPVMGDMLATEFRLAAAIVFYLTYPAGLVFLAVRPAFREGALAVAILSGAVLGFIAYTTYDLTNQATLMRGSTTLTIADLCWGTFFSAIASVAGYGVTASIRRINFGRARVVIGRLYTTLLCECRAGFLPTIVSPGTPCF